MKTYKRKFQTHIDLRSYSRFAEEVISGIETDTINVFRPDDEHALDYVWDKDGAECIDARATLPVSIREWLPVVCQFIRLETACDKFDGEWLAYYRSNAGEVLWPVQSAPAGPGALIAGIVVRHEVLKHEDPEHNCLKGLLAHELVHTFHAMRFVVPAFLNWRSFWRKVVSEGTCCDILASNAESRRLFLDRYGDENELAEIMGFWPSQGKKWFDAFYKVEETAAIAKLLDDLRNCADEAEKRKIRMRLRKLGHRGGLRGIQSPESTGQL